MAFKMNLLGESSELTSSQFLSIKEGLYLLLPKEFGMNPKFDGGPT